MMREGSAALEHAWNLPPGEARALQRSLAGQIVRDDQFGSLQTVAGADCGFPRREGQDLARAAGGLLGLPGADRRGGAPVGEARPHPYLSRVLSVRGAP